MKYRVRKEKYAVDYSNGNFQPCWTCKNACGGCSWSREFKPVEGWTAEPNYLKSNGVWADTYKIISCPQYEKDKR